MTEVVRALGFAPRRGGAAWTRSLVRMPEREEDGVAAAFVPVHPAARAALGVHLAGLGAFPAARRAGATPGPTRS